MLIHIYLFHIRFLIKWIRWVYMLYYAVTYVYVVLPTLYVFILCTILYLYATQGILYRHICYCICACCCLYGVDTMYAHTILSHDVYTTVVCVYTSGVCVCGFDVSIAFLTFMHTKSILMSYLLMYILIYCTCYIFYKYDI